MVSRQPSKCRLTSGRYGCGSRRGGRTKPKVEDADADNDNNLFDRYIGRDCGQVLRGELTQLGNFGASLICGLIVFVTASTVLRAQESPEKAGRLFSDQSIDRGNKSAEFSGSRVGFTLLKNITLDQKTIWTSPFHLNWEDGTWLFPLATVTGLSIATDHSFVQALTSDPRKWKRYRNFSNDGVAVLVAAGAASYVWSYISRDEHQRETGV